MIPTPHWLGWSAGILDGEGCIQVTTKGPRTSYNLFVVVVNTDLRMLQKLQEIWGEGSIVHYAKARPGRRDAWRWILSGRKALEFLKSVLPYLVVKKEQAETALSWELSYGVEDRTKRDALRQQLYFGLRELKRTPK